MSKKSPLIFSIGVMTGTSCDGADLATLSFDGKKESLIASATTEFPPDLARELKWGQSGLLSTRETALLTKKYSQWIGGLCNKKLKQWRLPLNKTIISIHGQTLWHEPDKGVSVQIADPAVISFLTKCTVVSSFRQPDLARGGQGAPLVPLYHWLCAKNSPFSKDLPFSIHNIGGISNLTYITPLIKNIIAFDTGPGNSLIDAAVEKMTAGRLSYDKDGKIALSAIDKVNWGKIRKIADSGFFKKRPPKSTGKELFNSGFLAQFKTSGSALVSNATALTAYTMATAYRDFIVNKGLPLTKIFLCGGGAKNKTLRTLFTREISSFKKNITVSVTPDILANPQYLEAMAFARLGIESLLQNKISLSNVTGASEDSTGASITPTTDFYSLLKLAHSLK